MALLPSRPCLRLGGRYGVGGREEEKKKEKGKKGKKIKKPKKRRKMKSETRRGMILLM